MGTRAAPEPIRGTRIDPPPNEQPPAVVGTLEQRVAAVGTGYRAFQRFSGSNASLLAAGTTYYLFLSLFALLAFAYGLAAILGADAISAFVTESLGEALPGLVGEGGIDPDQLRSIGRTSSVLGLALLLYSGSAAMVAASNALHIIYGAPPDPRNLVRARARLVGWLLVVAPLIAVSFAIPGAVASFAAPLRELLGAGTGTLAVVGAGLVGLLVDVGIVYLLLGILGGIRPAARPRAVGAAVGALLIAAIKLVLAFVVSWSVSKPQYGAFAVPITVLLVFYLLTLALYAGASLTGAVAGDQEPAD